MKTFRHRRLILKMSARKGAAAVEFALLLPLLFTMVLGLMEIGRGAMVSKTLDNAVRNGAQVAAQSNSSNATVISRINSVLTANNITAANATITIKVKDVVADVSTANPNDKISITVSISVSSASLTNFCVSLYQNMTFSSTLTVLRQG